MRVRWGVPAAALLSLCLAWGPAAADDILEFSLSPAAPTTGDPVRLDALIRVQESCEYEARAAVRFGTQVELGPADGWAIDLRLENTTSVCLPFITEVPARVDLGTLPVASGRGVLRLFARGALRDTAFFDLEVRAGPAAGWRHPVLHSGVSMMVAAAALTSVPSGVAVADTGRRAILIVDPATGFVSASFPAPGSGDVRGLAWDGAFLWASVRDFLGPRIYRIDLLGRVFDVFASPTVAPANEPLEGLGFLDGVLYGVLASPTILFAINPVTRQKIWERSLPARLLALDAVPEGLLGSDPVGTMYLLSPQAAGGNLLLADVLDNGITGLTDIRGLAFDGVRVHAWNAARSELLTIRPYALWWAVDGTLRAYLPERGSGLDVARGEVARIRQLAGNVDLGPLVCLLADGVTGVVPDTGDPPDGEAWFYVARFTTPEGFQLSYGRSRAGFRRLDLSSACP